MSDTIHIRMYNVGFGDCFLLTLPGKKTDPRRRRLSLAGQGQVRR